MHYPGSPHNQFDVSVSSGSETYIFNLESNFSQRKKRVSSNQRDSNRPPFQFPPQLARQRNYEYPDDPRDRNIVTQWNWSAQKSLTSRNDICEHFNLREQVGEDLGVDGCSCSEKTYAVCLNVGREIQRHGQRMIGCSIVVLLYSLNAML